MDRRYFRRSEPPPNSSQRVPDVARDKGVKLSRAQRRALQTGQLELPCEYQYESFDAAAEPEGF